MTRALTTLHRWSLYAYPPAFRAQFGRDLDAIFSARLQRASGLRRAGLAAWHIGDAIVCGVLERVHTASERLAWPRHHPPAADRPRRSVMTRDSFVADLRLTWRRARHSPGFVALTLVTLALGIGANAAIFSVVHAVLLKPLPYREPDRLVAIWSDNRHQGESSNPVSPADTEAFQKENRTFAGVEAMYSFLVFGQVGAPGQVETVQVATMTKGMFALLGRDAFVGRGFQTDDPDAVLVLSYAYWQRRFGGNPAIVGTTVPMPGVPVPVRILGVMPADFVFPYRAMLGPSGFSRALQPDVWVPLSARDGRWRDAAGQPSRIIHYTALIGRLKPDVTMDAARADLGAIAAARAAAFEDTNAGWGVTVRGLHDQTVRGIRPALVALTCGVGLLLLVACVNVANMLLARATATERDLAIRAALGASGARLVQQTLVETAALALVGGLLGLALMIAGERTLLHLAPRDLPRLDEVGPNWIVAAFAFLASTVTAIGIGVLPAWWAARSQPHHAMREGARASATRQRTRLRAALVVAEVSLATALTIGATLLLRSFVSVLQVNPGFDPEQLLTFQMNAPARPDLPARLAYYDDLEQRLASLPGVTEVGGTTRLPLGSTNVSTQVLVEGRATPQAQLPEVELRRAVFDYFGAMRMPILRGRGFTPSDGPGAPTVLVVNEAFVGRVFPGGENPLDQRVSIGGSTTGPWASIVGVVGNIRHGSLEEAPRPELYLYYRQNPPSSPFVVLRSSRESSELAAVVRDTVRATGAEAPYNVQPMREVRSESMSDRRFLLALIALFGMLAIVLAAVGVYGVITLVVAERHREVAVRLALGATPASMAALVLRQAVGLAMMGVAIGGALGLAVAPWLRALLFGVSAWDLQSHLAVAIVILCVGAAAALVPARRAMSVDPATSLR